MGEDFHPGSGLTAPSGGALGELSVAAGSIPPPEMLARYKELIPDAAERIFLLAERDSQYRYQLERAALQADAVKTYVAMGTGTGVAALCLVLGFIIVVSGNDVGAFIATLGVALFVGVFLYANRARRRAPQPEARSLPARTPHDLPAFDL